MAEVLLITLVLALLVGAFGLVLVFTSWLMRRNDRDIDSYGSEID